MEKTDIKGLCTELELAEAGCLLLDKWVEQELKRLRFEIEEACQLKISKLEKEEPTKKARKKRKKSDYQKWVSKCMKDKEIKKFSEASTAMKECALEWNVRKEDIKEELKSE